MIEKQQMVIVQSMFNLPTCLVELNLCGITL